MGLLNYFFQIVSSRYLSENEYVIFVAFLGIYSICTAPAAGLSLIVSRSVSKIISEKKEKYLGVNYLKFAKIILAYSFIFFFILYLNEDKILSYFEISDKNLILFLSLILLSHLFVTLNSSFFLGLKQFILYGISNLNIAIVKNITNFVFLFFSFGILSGVLGIASSLIITFLFGLFFLKKYFLINQFKSSGANYSLTFDKTWIPIILSNLGFGLMTQLDIAIAKVIFYGNNELHKFAAASVLAKAVLYISGGIALSTFPQMSEDNYNKNSNNDLLKKSLMLSIFISVLSIIFFYIFGNFLITFFFGDNYIGSEKYLFIYSAALIPMSLLLILEHYMMAKGKTLFIWILILLAPLQILTIYYFSENFYHIMLYTFIFSLLVLLIGLYMLIKNNNENSNNRFKKIFKKFN